MSVGRSAFILLANSPVVGSKSTLVTTPRVREPIGSASSATLSACELWKSSRACKTQTMITPGDSHHRRVRAIVCASMSPERSPRALAAEEIDVMPGKSVMQNVGPAERTTRTYTTVSLKSCPLAAAFIAASMAGRSSPSLTSTLSSEVNSGSEATVTIGCEIVSSTSRKTVMGHRVTRPSPRGKRIPLSASSRADLPAFCEPTTTIPGRLMLHPTRSPRADSMRESVLSVSASRIRLGAGATFSRSRSTDSLRGDSNSMRVNRLFGRRVDRGVRRPRGDRSVVMRPRSW
mmetsp:Transcript_65139/g.128825  ORF Transcript_65139/g.128825 Transcript_65139/m.128825 type:complete len:290 (-) Transcript_65139:113-982(-)